jgi:hypothetical protein
MSAAMKIPNGRPKVDGKVGPSANGRPIPPPRPAPAVESLPRTASPAPRPAVTASPAAVRAPVPPPADAPATTTSAASPNDPAAVGGLSRQTDVLSNSLFAVHAVHGLGLYGTISAAAMRAFLDDFVRGSRESGDPLEELLLSQAAVCHLQVGRVHALAEEAGALEAKSLYLAAGARLSRELCRTVETLVNYRDARRRTGGTPSRPAPVRQPPSGQKTRTTN